MVNKDEKPGKLMLLVPVGGRPQPVVVNSIKKPCGAKCLHALSMRRGTMMSRSSCM